MNKVKHGNKIKLTVTISPDILEKAKETSNEKHITLSGAIENFLKFFAEPWLYCFKCGEKFSAKEGNTCPKCGWIHCSKCGSCRCDLEEASKIAVFHMRKVYEDLLAGRVE